MKNKLFASVTLALLSTLNSQPSTANAQGSAFTYQGRLNDNGSPANGDYDLRFYLRDAATDGNPVGTTNTLAPVAVSNGLFNVTLDFGAGVFDGNSRWLEIGVRTNGSVAVYSTLSPRQPVTPTPYAIFAANSQLLNGQGANAFAPITGSPNYVAKSGDTMTGTLNLPADGLVAGGNQLVLSGGKVGIGTISPQATLDVAGNARLSRKLGIGAAVADNDNSPGIILDGTDNSGGDFLYEGEYLNYYGFGFRHTSDLIPNGPNAYVAGFFGIDFFTGGENSRMRIAPSGNVGIGTSSPSTLLHVNGGSDNGNLRLETSGYGKAASVQFKNTFGGTSLIHVIGQETSVAGGICTGDTPRALVLAAEGPNPIQFGVNDQIVMTMLSGGNVGIGTINPQAKFDVNGTVKATSFQGNGVGLTGVTSTPSGDAGGDLSGTYPNPTIANSAVTGAKIAAGQVVKSVNSLQDNVSITAGPNVTVTPIGNSIQISALAGGAGGDLTGTYPNPSIANGTVNSSKIASSAISDVHISSGANISASKIQGGDLGAARLKVGTGHTLGAAFSTIPGGIAAQTRSFGQLAYASGSLSASGDAQTSTYVLRLNGSAGSTQELFLDGAGQRMGVPVGAVWTFDVLLVGRNSGGNAAGFQIRGVIKNVGGTTSISGSLNQTILEDTLGTTVTVAADNASDALVVKVFYNLSGSTRWVASVRTAEAGF